MKKLSQITKSFFTDSVGLPAELFSDFPSISIAGERAIIENHKGLLAFSDHEVLLLTGNGKLRIQGSGFIIHTYSGQDFILSGKVSDVKFIEKV